MSDKFLASLLSENSNESCNQEKNYNIEKESHEELSFNGLIIPESDANSITKDVLAQDLNNSPVKETNTSDRNGNYNASTVVNGKEEVAVRSVFVFTAKRGIDDDNQTEVEVTKAATVNNEIGSLSTSSSFTVSDSQMNSEANSQKYRDDSDTSDDDTSTFSFDSSSDCSDSFLDKMHRTCSPATKIPNIKTKGELDLDELPPIEDLTIDVTETEMKKVGSIYAIVDKLVIVRALKDLQPLDLDSVLFLSSKNPLGRIFDVFGPVVEPFYSIRFNSPQHIADKCIIIDTDVFFAPEKKDITTYVFVDQLKKQKGSDASWQDNNEPPEEYLDYSDDDEERAAKRKRQAKNRGRNMVYDLEHEDDDDVQVIPNKASRDSKRKDAATIDPWVDIQKYKLSVSGLSTPSPKNPFRTPYSNSSSGRSSSLSTSSYSSYAKPRMAAIMTSKYPPERYTSLASQGGTSSLQHFPTQQNFASPQQSISPSPVFFSSPPPHLSQSPVPFLPPQSPLPFPFQHQRPPFLVQHPGMSPNPVFGQVPYFNQGLPSPMAVPPPPAFVVANPSPNFMNPPPNFANQSVSQASNFGNQNSAMAQAGAQWQQGPPSPYGTSPLSISIPNTPPPNAICTPIPSPYNMWGTKSLNFPQSGYFGNGQ